MHRGQIRLFNLVFPFIVARNAPMHVKKSEGGMSCEHELAYRA